MEKIQSAIAKARAARSAAQSSGAGPATVAKETAVSSGASPAAAPSSPTVEENRPDPSTVAALWSMLPSFAPAPGLLARNHIVTATTGKDAIPFDLMRTRLLGYLLIHTRQVDMIMLDKERATAYKNKMAADMDSLQDRPLMGSSC